MSWPIEQQLEVTVEFRDATEALFDPSTTEVQLRDPNGDLTTNLTLNHVSQGIYTLLINPDIPGSYWVKVTGDGPSTLHVATPWTLMQTEREQ